MHCRWEGWETSEAALTFKCQSLRQEDMLTVHGLGVIVGGEWDERGSHEEIKRAAAGNNQRYRTESQTAQQHKQPRVTAASLHTEANADTPMLSIFVKHANIG